jgi:hypothetical protein
MCFYIYKAAVFVNKQKTKTKAFVQFLLQVLVQEVLTSRAVTMTAIITNKNCPLKYILHMIHQFLHKCHKNERFV